MIIRRFGNRFHSVTLDFNPAAMTEVGFRRDQCQDWDAEEFMEHHEMIREEELDAEASDAVQEVAERTMLEALEEKFNAIHDALEEDQFISIESRSGVDYPRTRHARSTKGDLVFTYTLSHPLRVGIWERKKS
jgi:hypothetical protein